MDNRQNKQVKTHQSSHSAVMTQSFQATRVMIGASLQDFEPENDDTYTYQSSNLGSGVVRKKKKKKKKKKSARLRQDIERAIDEEANMPIRPGTTNIFHRLKAITENCLIEEEKEAVAISPSPSGNSHRKQKVILG